MSSPAKSAENTLCVTGASGFLGSWTVKAALDAGFYVHATTRSANKADYLKQLEGASDRLSLFDGCDLAEEGSFDKAIEGCGIVVHTASPFFFITSEDGVDKLVKPAVEGTKNVLNACNKLGVKKVVLTSSTASVYASFGKFGPDHVFSAKDWSPKDLLEEKKSYYALSKVLAEEEAWKIANSEGCTFKLAVMNPCLILGPLLDGQPHLNTSSAAVLRYFGAETYQQASTSLIDVRDVAKAHIAAAGADLDWSGWGQRFVIAAGSKVHGDVVKCLAESDIPDEWKAKLPTKANDTLPPPQFGAPPPHVTKIDAEQTLAPLSEGGLGLGSYITIPEMLGETMKTLIKNGLDSIQKYDLDK